MPVWRGNQPSATKAESITQRLCTALKAVRFREAHKAARFVESLSRLASTFHKMAASAVLE
jgi:hypothetical protein